MEINKKDTKIIRELDLNPKIATSALAKKVHLSQQVVDYRIKKLQEMGILKHFGTIINLSKLALQQYRVLFTLGDVTENEKKQILSYLKKHPQIFWAAIIGSKWDLFVVVLVKDYQDFENFLDEIFQKFSQKVKDYNAMYVLNHQFYGHGYLYQSNKQLAITLNYSTSVTQQIDELDHQILTNIQSSCRLSSLELGKRSNTTYKTIQNRIKKLEQQKVIEGYRIFLKSSEYGYNAYMLFISFNNYGREAEKKILSYAKEHPNITQAVKLFGQWSLQFHLRVKEYEDLQKIIIELRNLYPIIGNYEIIPVFEDIAVNLFPHPK